MPALPLASCVDGAESIDTLAVSMLDYCQEDYDIRADSAYDTQLQHFILGQTGLTCFPKMGLPFNPVQDDVQLQQ